jgi:putative tryptophan/tyrosine transport system substrate-binding protein
MQFDQLRRRDFITLLGGAAAAWPLAASAQQPAMPVVGFLSSGSQQSDVWRLVEFRRGLSETGYVEGRNVTSHFSWADEQYDRLPALATELVRSQPAVIVAVGGPAAALAAKAASTTIFIVFAIAGDPAAANSCIWQRALPRCRRCRASRGRKPIPRGRCALLSVLPPAAHST